MRAALILTFALSGCITIHRVTAVPPLRKNLAKLAGQSNKLMRSIQDGRRQRQKVLTRLGAEGVNLSQSPYPELQKSLGELAAAARKVKQAHDRIQKKRKNILGLTRGKKRIRDDHPAYAKVRTLYKSVGEEVEVLQGLAKGAKGKASAFDRLVKKHRIGEVNAATLSAKLSKQLKQSRTQLRSFRGDLAKARKIMGQKGQRMSPNARASRQKILSQMRLKLAQIDEILSQTEALAKRFEVERRKRPKFLVGPGMVAYDVLRQVMAANKALNREGKELRKLTQRFRVQ